MVSSVFCGQLPSALNELRLSSDSQPSPWLCAGPDDLVTRWSCHLHHKELLYEPSHALGLHRAHEWQPVQVERFQEAMVISARSCDVAPARCTEA